MDTGATPTYAVLFKCHTWQGFEARQIARLKHRVRSGDLFVFADNTSGPVRGIDHPPSLTVQAGRDDAAAIGLQHDHGSPVFWYSNDYPLHIFMRKFPHYQYYIAVEYDVAVQIDLDTAIRRMRDDGVDFVGRPIRAPLAEWPWRSGCDGWYAERDIHHWLSCLAIFSNRAAHYLYQRRLDANQRTLSGNAPPLPMCEAVIATELHLGGFRLMKLDELGAVTRYGTSPHYPEERLPEYASEAFVHPVLDRKRFLDRMFRNLPDPAVLLDDHPFRDIMTDGLMAEALPRVHHAVWRAQDEAACRRVIDAMRRVPDAAYRRLHGLDGRNLALCKPATQSSTSEWSLRPDEASGAVAGPISGLYRFHTRAEEQPWWMVDLQTVQQIGDVRVFNRMDFRSRANGLQIFVSYDGRRWELAGRHDTEAPFGGADGHPLAIPVHRPARFVRAELPAHGILHLDQVQVLSPDP